MTKISKTGISPLQQIKAEHLTRIIDALSGITPNTQIEVSGSVTASYFVGNGSLLTGVIGASSSYSISSSYAVSSSISSTSSYYNETDPIFTSISSSLLTTGSNNINGNQTITGSVNITGSIFINGINLSSSISPITINDTSIVSISPFSGSNYNSNYSIILGYNAGTDTPGANDSISIGRSAGRSSTNAYNSTFIGQNAGDSAPNAYSSFFIGRNSGNAAVSASNSCFIGINSGNSAIKANDSLFIGNQSGFNAGNAFESIFIGNLTGYSSISSSRSIFLGSSAGYQSVSASYSTLIGYGVGRQVTGSGIGSNNIILGTNITLPNNTKNSINFGGIIFATGSYNNNTGDPFSGSMSQSKVGINNNNPQYTLDVSGSVKIHDLLIINPTLTTPLSPIEGMIISSGSVGNSILYYYNGTSWNSLF